MSRLSCWPTAALWVVVTFIAPLGACTSYVDRSPFIRAAVVKEDYDGALEQIEKINGKSSRLLYQYEKGLVLHYQNRYEESNAILDEAELLNEDLYTRSISREVASLVVSDNTIQYRGEIYEALLIHYYKLFNHLYLGNPSGALVECRKLDRLLQRIADREGSDSATDPFLHYLTGMVYFAFRDYEDANVSLRLALNAYETYAAQYGVTMPEQLHCDLAASARTVFDREAASRYEELGDCDAERSDARERGTLNLFLECGSIPHREEVNAVIPIYKDDDTDKEGYRDSLYDRYGRPVDAGRKVDYIMRFAVPTLVAESPAISGVSARAQVDGRSYQAVGRTVLNLERQATDAFEARKAQIIGKAIVRNLTKYLAKKGADKESKVAGLLVNALNIATERADTRSWVTLPGTVRLVRLALPAGVHDVEVTVLDRHGGEAVIRIESITIEEGRTTFLNHRVH